MKNILFAFACTAVLAVPATAGVKTTTIGIDGFCDVYTVAITGGRLAAAVETDPDGRCETFVGAGHVGKVKGSGRLVTVGGVFNSNANTVYTLDLQYPLVTGGAWHMYSTTDGSVLQDLGGGTYTVEGSLAALRERDRDLPPLIRR